MTDTAQKIEALLFLAGEAVSRRELGRLLQLTPPAVAAAVAELHAALSERGISLVETATHVQLATSPAVSEYVTTYIQGETRDISAAAAETLAIIAYRGPVTRAEIDAIRGIDSRRMIRSLLVRGLIRRDSSSQEATGYSITPEFLLHLGLQRREELPRFAELSSHEKITELLEREGTVP